MSSILSKAIVTKYFSATLSAADIMNKYLNLSETPRDTTKCNLVVKGAPGQFPGTDFTVTVNPDQLNWDGLTLENTLSEGDEVNLMFV